MAFGGPDIPAAPPPPPPPSTNNADTQKKLDEAAAAERGAKGRSATLLSGGIGDQSDAKVSKRTLLGN